MTRLIIYAGPNGAGKSTLRDIGADQVDVVIDTDRIAKLMQRETGYPPKIEAGRKAIALFQQSIVAKKSIPLETTLSGSTILKRIRAAKDAGYDIELRYIALATVDLHVKRVGSVFG